MSFLCAWESSSRALNVVQGQLLLPALSITKMTPSQFLADLEKVIYNFPPEQHLNHHNSKVKKKTFK